jgi:hypothetical protein
MLHVTEDLPGKIVIIRKKPRRLPLAQTQIDRDQCIERRRCNGALYDRMTQILGVVLGGKITKRNLMDLAEKIAAQKQIKIDRGAKRMKEGLICWFCENVCDFPARQAAPCHEMRIAETSLEIWARPDEDEFDIALPALLTGDDLAWGFDPEPTP